MSVSTIHPPLATAVQSGHHAHRSHATGGSGSASAVATARSVADDKANESIEQLAAEGDPTAIAELKAEQVRPPSARHGPQASAAEPHRGATEPGKGDEVDVYV